MRYHILILLLVLGFVSVSEVVYSQEPIPDFVIEKSNQFVISKMGEDFFKKYISLDYGRSKYWPPNEACIQNPSSCAMHLQEPYYDMVYSLNIPEKPYAAASISFPVDTNGNAINVENDAIGFPECKLHPEECTFPIDEAEAIDIAKDAGIEQGIRKWETSFHWFAGDLKTYVWTVSNMLYESSVPSHEARGKTVVIDANSGKVCMVSEWSEVE